MADTEHALELIKLFRVDCLYAASKTSNVTAFIESQRHLPWPDFGVSKLVVERGSAQKVSAFADILTPMRQLAEELKSSSETRPRILLHDWSNDDPLQDVLLATFGALPEREQGAEDYRNLFESYLPTDTRGIAVDQPIELPNDDELSLSRFNSFGMREHMSIRGWQYPGVFLGDATSFEDIVTFWNLRACNVPLYFFDPNHAARLGSLRDQWLQYLPKIYEAKKAPKATVWSRVDRKREVLGDLSIPTGHVYVDRSLWNGLNIQAPIMFFGDEEVLANLDQGTDPPSISFPVSSSPMRQTRSYGAQRYVVSVLPGLGLRSDKFTLNLPFLPALNEFYGRSSVAQWQKVRAEPDSFGIIADGSTNHITTRALDIGQLVEAVFASVGISATPNAAGLICKRLILQMGSIDDCRVFRIAGVRKLIEDNRPDQSFTAGAAKLAIWAGKSDHPLSNYSDLHIEQRKPGTDLKADAVFSHLLRKEIFRPGLELHCPNCQLKFWRSLDEIRTKSECEYCGHMFHIGPQLKDRDWAYRRSGLFGRNDNQEGAIPVVLTLQQLMNMHGRQDAVMDTALSLEPNGADIKKCETDFAFITTGLDEKLQLVIGECKTRQPISQDDVRNLIRVANAFPADSIQVFIIFAKLAEFSEEELRFIAEANEGHVRRAIVLTHRELEPWTLYERTAKEFDIERYASGLEEMAEVTNQVFFEKRARGVSSGPEADGGTL